MNRRVDWFLLALAAAACVGSVVVAMAPRDEIFVDWRTYSAAVDRFLRGESLYAPRQLTGPYALPDLLFAGYAYPPPSILFFVPFAATPLGLPAWLAFNVGLLVSGLAAVLRRELGHGWLMPMAIALAGLSVAPSFVDGVATANLNVGLAGLLAWVWASGSRRSWIAPVAGLAAILKVLPGVLALWPARTDRWRSLLVCAVVAAGIAGVTLPLFGIEGWFAFARALANAVPACTGRISIACSLIPVTGVETAKLAGILAGLGLAVGVLVIRRPIWAFLSLAGALLAPVADMHPHYWLILYVVAVVAVASVVGERRRATAVAVRTVAREGVTLTAGPSPSAPG